MLAKYTNKIPINMETAPADGDVTKLQALATSSESSDSRTTSLILSSCVM